MENTDPEVIDLLIETHIGLDRQGPGSKEVIEKALGFLGSPDRFERIADLGCGTGGQTMILAEHLQKPQRLAILMVGDFCSHLPKEISP